MSLVFLALGEVQAQAQAPAQVAITVPLLVTLTAGPLVGALVASLLNGRLQRKSDERRFKHEQTRWDVERTIAKEERDIEHKRWLADLARDQQVRQQDLKKEGYQELIAQFERYLLRVALFPKLTEAELEAAIFDRADVAVALMKVHLLAEHSLADACLTLARLFFFGVNDLKERCVKALKMSKTMRDDEIAKDRYALTTVSLTLVLDFRTAALPVIREMKEELGSGGDWAAYETVWLKSLNELKLGIAARQMA